MCFVVGWSSDVLLGFVSSVACLYLFRQLYCVLHCLSGIMFVCSSLVALFVLVFPEKSPKAWSVFFMILWQVAVSTTASVVVGSITWMVTKPFAATLAMETLMGRRINELDRLGEPTFHRDGFSDSIFGWVIIDDLTELGHTQLHIFRWVTAGPAINFNLLGLSCMNSCWLSIQHPVS